MRSRKTATASFTRRPNRRRAAVHSSVVVPSESSKDFSTSGSVHLPLAGQETDGVWSQPIRNTGSWLAHATEPHGGAGRKGDAAAARGTPGG